MKTLIQRILCPLSIVVMLVAMSACSKEDDMTPAPAPDGFAQQLIGDWEIAGLGEITFNADGTGYMTIDDADEEEMALSPKKTAALSRGTYTIHFTWKYDSTTHTVDFELEGEHMQWTVIDHSDGTVTFIDDEGDPLTINRKGETPDEPELPVYTVGPKEWLIGKWGAAGIVRYEFTENGFFRIYSTDSDTGSLRYESVPYTYDPETHTLTFGEDFNNLNVSALTQEYIRIGNGEYNFFLSRILDDEEYHVGDISLIYDKTLVAMGVATLDNSPVTMSMTIGSNKTFTMLPGGKFNYTYDAATQTLTLSMFGEEIKKMKMINLTATDLIFEWLPDEEDPEETVSRMEYRAL